MKQTFDQPLIWCSGWCCEIGWGKVSAGTSTTFQPTNVSLVCLSCNVAALDSSPFLSHSTLPTSFGGAGWMVFLGTLHTTWASASTLWFLVVSLAQVGMCYISPDYLTVQALPAWKAQWCWMVAFHGRQKYIIYVLLGIYIYITTFKNHDRNRNMTKTSRNWGSNTWAAKQTLEALTNENVAELLGFCGQGFLGSGIWFIYLYMWHRQKGSQGFCDWLFWKLDFWNICSNKQKLGRREKKCRIA